MNVYWTPELATGVEAIDKQHQELFVRVDRLVAACIAGKGSEETLSLLAFLKNYTLKHLAAEEQLMIDSGYPRAEFHVQEHALFRQHLESLEEEAALAATDGDLLTAINQSIVDWLFDHVCVEDRDLGRHLKSKND